MIRSLSAIAAFCAPFAALAADVSIETDFGQVVLSFAADGGVTGANPRYQGRLEGRRGADGALEMIWAQPISERGCATPRLGSLYWGTVTWAVAADGRSLSGRWAYCDDPAGSAGLWNGRVVGGTIPPAVAGVDMADLAVALRETFGQNTTLADWARLTIDLNCDGANDHVLGRVDQDHPDGPFFALLAVARRGDAVLSDHLLFGLGGDGGPDSLCAGPDAPAPELAAGPRLTPAAFGELFGFVSACGQAVTLSDGLCDVKSLFWEDEPKMGGRLLLSQN